MNRLGFAVGLLFGLVIAAARLNDYDVIHDMLLLREPDVFLLMASAIAVAAPALWLLRRRGWHTRYGGPLALPGGRVERKHVLGAIVFGTGWAITGSCPGPALAMVAGGKLLGLPVAAGLLTGQLLRDRVAGRSMRRASSGAARNLARAT